MSYLQFVDTGKTASGKTWRWSVKSATGGDTWLGTVKWFAQWRKYCFFPLAGTVFDAGCLAEIATFCEVETVKHKQ